MRLLLIDEDPKFRALIRHHVGCRWPEAQISAYLPLRRGPLPAEFLAQGYDAVLVAEAAHYGKGLDWLCELPSRAGFAPVIFMPRSEQELSDARIADCGAFAVVPKERLGHRELIGLLEAAERKHQQMMADWRVSAEAEEASHFGSALIPGYRRARLLVSGQISQLYVAESEKAGTLLALKVTRSQRDDNTGQDQSFERFLREYEMAQRVRHPNIVRFYELGVTDDHAYLAMEYFQYGDLRQRMRGGLSPQTALSFASQIARALGCLHAAGILHRDLKPGNVMLRVNEQIALIDFGLAKHEAPEFDITDTGRIAGTPHYMSPEQGHGQNLDPRSDLYSLGVVLFEMLTGQKPYSANNPMTIIYMHRNAPLPHLPAALAALQPLLDRLLGKRPQDRFADAGEVAQAIEVAQAQWRLS